MPEPTKLGIKKYSFSIVFLIAIACFMTAGLLEATVESVTSLHISSPIISSVLWHSVFAGLLTAIYFQELKEFLTSPRLFRRMIAKLSTMQFAIFLLSFAILLVFVGTLGQSEQDVWRAVGHYFRCFITRVPLSIFVSGEASPELKGCYIFLPGGYLLGAGLLINMVAAQFTTFIINPIKYGKIPGFLITGLGFAMIGLAVWYGVVQEDIPSAYVDSYKRVLIRLGIGVGISVTLLSGCVLLFRRNAGLVLLHFGVIMLLISELITGLYASEGQMRIQEGESAAFVDLDRQFELAITDLNDNSHKEKSVLIPESFLKETGVWQKAGDLPFEFKVNRWYDRASIGQRRVRPPENSVGLIQQNDLKEESGESSNRTPGLEIVLRDSKRKEFATLILSLNFYYRQFPQMIYTQVEGRSFNLMLRNKRSYLFSQKTKQPFSIKLLDFRYDKYIGTRQAKNFSSLVRLIDKEKGVDRKILISMNNPLRYSGRTFYQSSFLTNESGTILSVVENPGWMIPYICCMLVGIGMMFHFADALNQFMRKKS